MLMNFWVGESAWEVLPMKSLPGSHSPSESSSSSQWWKPPPKS